MRKKGDGTTGRVTPEARDTLEKRGIPPKILQAFEASRAAQHAALQWAVFTKPEDRLRWVLDFSTEDLSILSPNARIEKWEQLATFMPPHASGGFPFGPGSEEHLSPLQAELRRGLRIILGDQVNEEWHFPGPSRLSFYRVSTRFTRGPKDAETAPQHTKFAMRWDYQDQSAMILAGVAALIQVHGGRLRGCKKCGAPFLATKRQIYCGPRCSQHTRDGRRARP
jgi:hypothetical protein